MRAVVLSEVQLKGARPRLRASSEKFLKGGGIGDVAIWPPALLAQLEEGKEAVMGQDALVAGRLRPVAAGRRHGEPHDRQGHAGHIDRGDGRGDGAGVNALISNGYAPTCALRMQ